MNLKNFSFETDADGIATIIWDMPGKTTNLIDESAMDDLDAIAERLATDAGIRGAILTSAKEGFCGGADISMLTGLNLLVSEAGRDPEAVEKLYNGVSRLSRVIRKIETCGKPVVAALPGTAVGGGYEIALGCHHRIAAKVPRARYGLPEGKIGLLPGAGGTQRLARLLGASEALQLMLKGTIPKMSGALGARLIDKVVPKGRLLAEARKWILANPGAAAPWDIKGFRIPGGPPYSKSGMMTFAAANAIYRRETYDNYPGLRALMKAVYDGLLVDIDTALRIEARLFAHVLMTPEARNMMRTLFFSMRELGRGARRPAGVKTKKLRKIGIIGAGLMGAGIAHVTAAAGLRAVLLDRDLEAAEKGKAHTAKAITKRIAQGRATSKEREAVLARIHASDTYADLRGCDLVIEAVFENRDIKTEVSARAEAVLGRGTIYASNTSTLPITSLAATSKRPENFVGIHFFSPVERMMLVEIIIGEQTGDTALATALDFVSAIGKTPIVVQDSRGFYTSRVVGTYISEGHAMLMEGVPAAMIENLGRIAGMPMGPLALNDEVAIDLALKITRATKADLGPAYPGAPGDALLEAMVETHGRLGHKNRKGFYDYPKIGKKTLWPGLAKLLPPVKPPEDFDAEEIKQRLLVIQALETARCFEDGILTDVRDADVGGILGFGFAPFSGGPLSYIDMVGTGDFVARCKALETKFGPRFKPSALLIEMAARGESFYGRFAPEKPAREAA
ncbi:Enoyl-CoA hydratase [isoleucine degradation] / 3-hydroxyacyl-CoA dehydrogenase / 3-hydroxybutyryl-CoA epimerase [hydrothermal vent metagenome]|uniref:Enoyl-CoA hydratase [isoleucine degradation] / 3-hydroxyacyl-CoA dehydrogenase / 3-hydroxybutyryl-CoA epimerase n=1 Tax=hydrothermal vent metagenome TaxID=652676 RepID=A0A3B0T3W4_9ZZZZ